MAADADTLTDDKIICSNCEHAAFGSGGVYCTRYNEDIWLEKVAQECADFTPVPWASKDAKGDTDAG